MGSVGAGSVTPMCVNRCRVKGLTVVSVMGSDEARRERLLAVVYELGGSEHDPGWGRAGLTGAMEALHDDSPVDGLVSQEVARAAYRARVAERARRRGDG
jgi:hypothetical protein